MQPKFRGLSTKDNKFIFGSLAYMFNNEVMPMIMPNSYYSTKHLGEYNDQDEEIISETEFALGGFIPVFPETVGLFTGFTDAGKSDLYHGDVIENDGTGYVIEWCKDSGSWQCIDSEGNNISLCELASSKETWLQGNKYQNPELLKKAPKTATFTRLQLISITDGRLSTEMSDVYKIFNHIFDRDFFTHELMSAMHRLKEVAPEWFVSECKYLETIPKETKENWEAFIAHIKEHNIELEIPQIIF